MSVHQEAQITIDSRFEEQRLREAFKGLEEKGFQRWPQPINLTRFKFRESDCTFQVEATKTPQEATQEVIDEAKKLSGRNWQATTVVETFNNNQQRVHVLLRLVE